MNTIDRVGHVILVEPKRDPFYVVQGKVDDELNTLDEMLLDARVHAVSFTSSTEFNPRYEQLHSKVKATKEQVGQLDHTIHVVESHRSKFHSISDDELIKRKQLVELASTRLEVVIEQIKVVEGMYKHKYATTTTTTTTTSKSEEKIEEVGTDYEAKQNEILGSMSESLARLALIGHEIDSEMDQHTIDLNQLQDGIDEGQSSLRRAVGKVDALLVKKNPIRCRMWCIVVLLFFVFLLLILIVYA